MAVFLPVFALPFIMVGGALIFGSKALIIDKSRKVAITTWKLIVLVKSTEFPLDKFNIVSVSKHVGDSDSPTTYPVELRDRDGASVFQIDNPMLYPQARKMSEQVAQFLNWPVEDSASGAKVVSELEHLDETVAARTKRTGERLELPAPPPVMRSRVEELGRQLIVNIPGARLGLGEYLGIIVPLGIAMYIVAAIFSRAIPIPMQYRLFAVGLVALAVIVLGVLPAVRKIRSSTLVTASPEELKIEERIGSKKKITTIPGNELEELVLPTRQSFMGEAFKDQQLSQPGNYNELRMPDGQPVPKWLLILNRMAKPPGITASSDKVTVAFGASLPEDELAYLYAMIKKAMVE